MLRKVLARQRGAAADERAARIAAEARLAALLLGGGSAGGAGAPDGSRTLTAPAVPDGSRKRPRKPSEAASGGVAFTVAATSGSVPTEVLPGGILPATPAGGFLQSPSVPTTVAAATRSLGRPATAQQPATAARSAMVGGDVERTAATQGRRSRPADSRQAEMGPTPRCCALGP